MPEIVLEGCNVRMKIMLSAEMWLNQPESTLTVMRFSQAASGTV